MTMGRPTIYTTDLADAICEAVATSTLGLARICDANPHFPRRETIYQWRYKNPDFSDRYIKAKQCQADLLAEECLAIADDGRNDYMQALSEDGKCELWKFTTEHVNRSRLRIDTRKFLAAKLMPQIYGDNKKDDKPSIGSVVELLVDKLSEK
jgi:hypothetical protein